MGAVSDLQVDQARNLIEAAGQRFEYHSFPEVGHFLHAENPALYVDTLLQWTKTLKPIPAVAIDATDAVPLVRAGFWGC